MGDAYNGIDHAKFPAHLASVSIARHKGMEAWPVQSLLETECGGSH